MGVNTRTNREWNQEIWDRLHTETEELQILGYKIMVVGDFNGHIGQEKGEWERWGKENENGRNLLRLVEKRNLTIANKSRKCKGRWTWSSRGQKSTIDFALMDNWVGECLEEMTIDEDQRRWTTGSDHCWIQIKLKGQVWEQRATGERTKRWKINRRTKWAEYRERMALRIQAWEREKPPTGGYAEKGYRELMNIIMDCAVGTIGWQGRKRACGGEKSQKMKRLLRRRRITGAKWRADCRKKKEPSAVTRKMFLKARAAVARERARERLARMKHHRYQKAANERSRDLWAALRAERSGEGITALYKEGEVTVNPEEIKKIIHEHWTQLGQTGAEEREVRGRLEEAKQGGPEVKQGGEGREETEPLREKLTVEEGVKQIKALRTRKAMGEDLIPNELIKEGGKALARALIEVFNDMIEEEWTPPEWSEERITLLHKGGDRKDINNYRGIAISSNIGKLFTKLVNARLYQVAEDQGWLGEMQAGFRAGRSTKDNLFILGQLAERAQQKGEKLFVIFIDFQKAYDRVWREGLWNCLQKTGIGGKTIRVIQSLYKGHRRRVRTAGGNTKWAECNRGLKQGCVLSPLLFALFVAELEKRLIAGGEGPTCGGGLKCQDSSSQMTWASWPQGSKV